MNGSTNKTSAKKYVTKDVHTQDEWHWIIRDDRTLNGTEKGVMHAIVSRLPDPFPSLDTIALDSGFSKTTVINAINGTFSYPTKRGKGEARSAPGTAPKVQTRRGLVDKGWLEVIARYTESGDRDSNAYRPKLPDGTRKVVENGSGKLAYAGVVAEMNHGSCGDEPRVVAEMNPKTTRGRDNKDNNPASKSEISRGQNELNNRSQNFSSEQSERGTAKPRGGCGDQPPTSRYELNDEHKTYVLLGPKRKPRPGKREVNEIPEGYISQREYDLGFLEEERI